MINTMKTTTMGRVLAAGAFVAAFAACGGATSTRESEDGRDQSALVENGVQGSGSGETACAPSDCADSDCACSTGPAFDFRCVRGPAGGSAGPHGICTMTCQCPPGDGVAPTKPGTPPAEDPRCPEK